MGRGERPQPDIGDVRPGGDVPVDAEEVVEGEDRAGNHRLEGLDGRDLPEHREVVQHPGAVGVIGVDPVDVVRLGGDRLKLPPQAHVHHPVDGGGVARPDRKHDNRGGADHQAEGQAGRADKLPLRQPD